MRLTKADLQRLVYFAPHRAILYSEMYGFCDRWERMGLVAAARLAGHAEVSRTVFTMTTAGKAVRMEALANSVRAGKGSKVSDKALDNCRARLAAEKGARHG